MYNLKLTHNGEILIGDALIKEGTSFIESHADNGDIYKVEITITKKEAHQCDCSTPCLECKCCKR